MRMKKTFLIFDKDVDINNESEPLLRDGDSDSSEWQVLLFIIILKSKNSYEYMGPSFLN